MYLCRLVFQHHYPEYRYRKIEGKQRAAAFLQKSWFSNFGLQPIPDSLSLSLPLPLCGSFQSRLASLVQGRFSKKNKSKNPSAPTIPVIADGGNRTRGQFFFSLSFPPLPSMTVGGHRCWARVHLIISRVFPPSCLRLKQRKVGFIF